MKKVKPIHSIALGLMIAVGSAVPTKAQDMLQYIDLNSDEFTKSDMTRAEIEVAIAAKGAGVVNLFGKRLNGLDLSALDLRKAVLKAAYINRTNFTGANLDGAVLDRAWALKSNFQNATFKGASLLESQMMDATFDGADFSGARLAPNMSRASFVKARFDGADLSRHGRLQAFRANFTSATLDKSSFRGATLGRAVFDFSSLRDADLSGADLSGCSLAGADLTGANIGGANFNDADVNSAKLLSLRGRDGAIDFEKARNLDQALRD